MQIEKKAKDLEQTILLLLRLSRIFNALQHKSAGFPLPGLVIKKKINSYNE